MTVADFAEPGEFFRIGREPVMVDLLPEIAGVEFDQAWKGRVEAVVDEPTGVRAFFISAKDLITSKLAAGRPQDMADAEAVRSAGRRHVLAIELASAWGGPFGLGREREQAAKLFGSNP